MRRVRVLLAIGLCAAACQDQIPAAPTGLDINPREGPNNRPTHVVLGGDFLSVRIKLDFDSPSSAQIEKRMSATLNAPNAAFALTGFQVINIGQVGAQVPGVGMPIGDYDLVVTDTEGRSATLPAAFHIRQGTCADLTPPNRSSNVCMAGCNGDLGCGCFGKQPATCKTICGDGKVFPPEACDDGNTVDGDGCSHDCTMIEAGWSCTGGSPTSPSVCTPICGDGLRVGPEREIGRCDDGNTMDGDGCSHDCKVEPGWMCDGTPSACGKCGDGKVEGDEQCDDGNLLRGDGCSPTCTVESGWSCTRMVGALSTCTRIAGCPTTCGNGVIDNGEQCDDGNLIAGDGCNPCCQIEMNYTCVRQPSVCVLTDNVAFVDANNACNGTGTHDDPYCSISLAVPDPRTFILIAARNTSEQVDIVGQNHALIGYSTTGLDYPTIQHLRIRGQSNVAVLGLEVRGGSGAVDVADMGTIALLLQCKLGPSQGIGVLAESGTKLTMDRDLVGLNTSGGLVLDGDIYHITNSIIVQNGTMAMSPYGGVAIVSTATVSTFVNNTVADNQGPDSGREISCSTSAPIVNSIVWDSVGSGASAIGTLCSPSYSDLPIQTHNGGNISADPQLNNAYHISSQSPCIDHGDPAGTILTGGPAPIDDYSGHPRPLRLAVDIGADEVP
jgi:cysteine-rich repeat protein